MLTNVGTANRDGTFDSANSVSAPAKDFADDFANFGLQDHACAVDDELEG